MRMWAERGKIADDVSVSDPQSVRTVSQRSNIKTQRRFRFYMKLHKSTQGFRKKSLGNKL